MIRSAFIREKVASTIHGVPANQRCEHAENGGLVRVHGDLEDYDNKVFVHGVFVGTNKLHYKYCKGKITNNELAEILHLEDPLERSSTSRKKTRIALHKRLLV